MALDIKLDISRLDLAVQIGASVKQIKEAYNRALVRTIQFLSIRLAKDLSLALDIPQKALKFRLIKSVDRNNLSGSLWIGLNPMGARYLGKARQTKTGVSIRTHRFDNAFIAKMRNDHINIFRRKTAKPLPLENLYVKMDRSFELEELFWRYQSQADDYFERRFSVELNNIKSKDQ